VKLFPILIIKLISGLLSIRHNRSFPLATAVLFTLVAQKSSSSMQSSSSYERAKNKSVTMLLSIQKAQKGYTLIL
jgi:hypothetical protein